MNPYSDPDRLAALHRYIEPGTPPLRDAALNRIVELAAGICNTPVAEINLIDDKFEWKKATYGFDTGTVPREISFCNVTVLKTGLYEIPDMKLDEIFKDHPYVTGPFGVKFYAGVPLRTPEGHGIGTLCVIDMAPKQLSDIQRKTLLVLADEVLARLEMTRQQQVLEQSVQEKEFLMKMLNHDIRNPLCGVLAASEELQASTSGETQRLASLIFRSGTSLLELSDRVLSGDYFLKNPEARPINLTTETRSVAFLHELMARAKAINLVEISKEQVWAKVKTNHWHHIVTNLINNAIKFTPAGGTVSWSVESFQNGGFMFFVEDSGIGMSETELDSVLMGTSGKLHDGTDGESGFGLGIPLVLRLAKEIGASVSATSTPGEGTKFVVKRNGKLPD